jgi:hypothetical protein
MTEWEPALELVGGDTSLAIPPHGTEWHDLSWDYCYIFQQSDYHDNDHDELLSVDDTIKLGGTWCPVTWVGLSYYLVTVEAEETKIIRTFYWSRVGDPTEEEWREMYPQFCTQIVISAWTDVNTNGVFDADDLIVIDRTDWRVSEARAGIVALFPDPVDESTWGWIKSLYRRLRGLLP